MQAGEIHLEYAPIDKKNRAHGGDRAGWYILRLVSGLDFLAEEALRGSGWDIFLARETKWRALRWRQRRRSAQKRAVEAHYPRFPGYLFVNVTPPRWPDIASWPLSGVVRGILAMDGSPVPLALGEIERLMAEDGAAPPPVAGVPLHRAFTAGQRVRVLVGAFRDFEASLDAIDDNGADITVEVFGRPTPLRRLSLEWLEAA